MINYALRHIETGEYICTYDHGDGVNYLALFGSRASADATLLDNKLVEFCEVVEAQPALLAKYRYYEMIPA